MGKELPKGVTKETIYRCNICGHGYANPEDAGKCFEKGTDYIDFPKGLVLGLGESSQDFSYLLLEKKINGGRHETLFWWKSISPNFYFQSFTAFGPHNSSTLRERLRNEKCPLHIRPLTDKEFNYFLDRANNLLFDGFEEYDMPGKDITKAYDLVHKHSELDRILKEEGIN